MNSNNCLIYPKLRVTFHIPRQQIERSISVAKRIWYDIESFFNAPKCQLVCHVSNSEVLLAFLLARNSCLNNIGSVAKNNKRQAQRMEILHKLFHWPIHYIATAIKCNLNFRKKGGKCKRKKPTNFVTPNLSGRKSWSQAKWMHNMGCIT